MRTRNGLLSLIHMAERAERKRQDPTENFASTEKMLPRVDAIAILGGLIEQVEIKGVGNIWRPARYVKEATMRDDGRLIRSDRRRPLGLDETLSHEHLQIGGGAAHIAAGIQYIDEIRRSDGALPLVIFAAGKPDYLAQYPSEISEANIMLQEFERKMPDVQNLLALDQGKNTHDDVLNTLRAANERGLKTMAFVVTSIRLKRSREWYRQIVRTEFPEAKRIKAYFIAAEDLLRRRYSANPHRLAEFERVQRTLQNSELWKKVEAMERRGVQALRKGTYKPLGF